MHSSGSVLKTITERLRSYLDEPSSKWTNDHLVRHVITPEMVNVLSRLELNAQNPIIFRADIAIEKGTEYYQLPPNAGAILRVAELDSEGRLARDWEPRNERHPRGPNWALEGNTIAFRPFPTQDWTNMQVWYTPSGDFLPHYSETGVLKEVGNQVKRLELGTATLGEVDRRANAYVGATLRLLPDSPGVIEERVISAHAPEATTPYVDVRLPFDHIRNTGSWSGSSSSAEESSAMKYEIVMPGMQSMATAIAASGAMHLGVYKNITEKQYGYLRVEYKKALKSAGDRLANMNMRKPQHYDPHTLDNPNRSLWFITS